MNNNLPLSVACLLVLAFVDGGLFVLAAGACAFYRYFPDPALGLMAMTCGFACGVMFCWVNWQFNRVLNHVRALNPWARV